MDDDKLPLFRVSRELKIAFEGGFFFNFTQKLKYSGWNYKKKTLLKNIQIVYKSCLYNFGTKSIILYDKNLKTEYFICLREKTVEFFCILNIFDKRLMKR